MSVTSVLARDSCSSRGKFYLKLQDIKELPSFSSTERALQDVNNISSCCKPRTSMEQPQCVLNTERDTSVNLQCFLDAEQATTE